MFGDIMAGVMQSEYLLPREQCVSFCDALKEKGLVALPLPAITDEEFLLRLASDARGKSQPVLSFWTASPDKRQRRVDLIWVVGQEELAAQVENLIRNHEGIVTFGAITERT